MDDYDVRMFDSYGGKIEIIEDDGDVFVEFLSDTTMKFNRADLIEFIEHLKKAGGLDDATDANDEHMPI